MLTLGKDEETERASAAPAQTAGHLASANVIAILVALSIVAASVRQAHAHAPKPCPSAAYVAFPQPLIDGSTDVEDNLVVVQGNHISIGNACAPVTAAIRILKNGYTVVRSRWVSCAGLSGKVRLQARIDPTCRTIARATFRTKHFIKRFSATVLSDVPSFSVDASLTPFLPSLDGPSGVRPLATIGDDRGGKIDFVENELILATDDDQAVADFLARWAGEVVDTYGPRDYGLDLPARHVVRIATDLADEAQLARSVRDLDPRAAGAYRFSSVAGHRLLSAATSEAAAGLHVSVNWILQPSGYLEGFTLEAPSSPYGPDTRNWSYLNSGSTQDIGVTRAWQALALAGRLQNTVPIAIIDQGFATYDQNDYNFSEAYSAVSGVAAIGTPGVLHCAGGGPGCGECCWHGTNVASTAMANGDDGFGSIGVAAPIAHGIFVRDGGDTASWDRAIGLAMAHGARIINISAGGSLSAGLWFREVAGLEDTTRAARNAGVLVFAAALESDVGQDTDALSCTFLFAYFCYEKAWNFPCENDGVTCVAALDRDSTNRAPFSDYGTDRSGLNTIDIFAPGYVLAGRDPDHPGNGVQWVPGTSVASPFAAGVAALIWAANPDLSADQVEDTLLRTAHPSADVTVGRYVDAYAAVIDALGFVPVLPSIPADRLTQQVAVPANQMWVDTAIKFVYAADPLIVSASGRWSNHGLPSLGPQGFVNVKYPGTLLSSGDLASLIGRVGNQLFAIGPHFAGPSPAEGGLALSINDVPGTFGDNEGAMNVLVSFAGSDFTEVKVPANVPWTNTGIIAPPGTPFLVRASGLWSNVGPPTLGPNGHTYLLPGTVLASASLGSLIGRVGSDVFPLGSVADHSFATQETLFLGMNDVPGTFGDNEGQITVDVYYGRIIP